MDQTREERLQQRLRGAQRREITDVDFGLFLPPAATPPVPSKPQGQTQTALQPELPSQPSTRRSPRAHGRLSNSNLPVATPSANDANTSAKRRPLEIEDVAPVSSTRSTRSSQATPRPDIYDLPEDGPRSEPAAEVSQVSIAQISETSVLEQGGATLVQASTQAVEVTESHDNAPPTDSDKVAAQPEVSQPSVKSSLEEVESVVHVPRKKRRRGPAPKVSPEEPRRSSARGVQAPAVDEIDELTPQPKRQRRSKLVAQADNDADDIDELSPQITRRRRRVEAEQVPNTDEASADAEPIQEEVDVEEKAVEIDDAEAAAVLKKNRGRRVSRGVPEDEVQEEVAPEPAIPKKQRGRPRLAVSPVQQRHPKLKQTKAPAKAKSPADPKETKARLGSPIPVTVHRLTRRPQYDEDESDADILNMEIPYARRGGANAVDVLSQLCQEIIGSALEKLEESATDAEDAALRREFKTKYRAVEGFGREIETRLLEHTINLDNGRALEKRVRDELRKKFALREEILRIRAERQQVALRMDQIRIKHEQERETAEKRDTLNNALHDIELAVERGKAKQEPDEEVEKTGIEMLLMRVAGEVSSKSDEGGILKQVKEFNAFLERAALALKA